MAHAKARGPNEGTTRYQKSILDRYLTVSCYLFPFKSLELREEEKAMVQDASLHELFSESTGSRCSPENVVQE